MAQDIHVWLSDAEAEALKVAAKRDDRSVTNMACVYIRRCLRTGGITIADEEKPRRGRPPKTDDRPSRVTSAAGVTEPT